MMNKEPNTEIVPNRRQALLGLSGATALVVGGAAVTAGRLTAQSLSCVLSSQMTEGPYWVDEKLNRSDIRVDPSDGSTKPGTPLTITLNLFSVTSSGCAPLPNALVDVWHCDAGGLYSDVQQNNTVGKKFLRGYQVTNSSGVVNFTTIYPGWYNGRAVHIHIRIRTYNGTTVVGNFTTQLFFDEAVTDEAFSVAPYNARPNRDTRNANDMVFNGAANKERALATVTKTDSGYAATLNIGVNIAAPAAGVTTPYVLPQAVFGGGWYTALYFANTTAQATSITLNFVGENGSPLAVTLPGMGSNATHTISIDARATALVELANSATTMTQGWVEANLPEGVLGYAVFRQTVSGRADQEAVVPLAPETATSVQLVFDDVNFTTGIAIVNPLTQQTVLTITAYSATGTQLGTGQVTLSSRSKTAITLREVSGLAGVAGNRGWLSIATTTGTVAALGLRFGSAAFTSIPATHK
jgi:protocatechuate 3,4-dioxygenase beta subunit